MLEWLKRLFGGEAKENGNEAPAPTDGIPSDRETSENAKAETENNDSSFGSSDLK